MLLSAYLTATQVIILVGRQLGVVYFLDTRSFKQVAQSLLAQVVDGTDGHL